jgi:hypothetical protein
LTELWIAAIIKLNRHDTRNWINQQLERNGNKNLVDRSAIKYLIESVQSAPNPNARLGLQFLPSFLCQSSQVLSEPLFTAHIYNMWVGGS